MARILLAEDDEIMRITLYDRLTKNGWDVDQAANGNSALRLIKEQRYQLVISDIRMPGLDGIQLMEMILNQSPATDVILMTAFGSVEDAIACLKKGAADYILKPFDMDDLTIRVKRLFDIQTVKARCASLEESNPLSPIIGSSTAIRNVIKLIGKVSQSDSTVLITGESGTGKELVAAAIHYGSIRAQGPYIRVNCAAIPDGLIESELFGHEKGAFTGATARKLGRFEAADGGTILLDEIGELPIHLQAKLLRVLQEREIERVGGTSPIKVNTRILGATAKNLQEEVKQGSFREDLFYRLQVIPIEIPPLRERREDIPELCRYFLEEFCKERGIDLTITDHALAILSQYNFPGNVRELRNIIERAHVLTHSQVIEPWNLPLDLAGGPVRDENDTLDLAKVLAKTEKAYILKALEKTSGKRTEAAKLLGISRKNLWEKMKVYHVAFPTS